MSLSLRIGLPVLALLALLPFAAQASVPKVDPANVEIARQLVRYQEALNGADLEQVMALYAEDAVFMPQYSEAAVGRQAVRASYRRIFDTIRLDVRFQIDEIRLLSKDWAYARTRSNGTVKVLKSEQPTGPEANQELFLLHRENDGQWRFARYLFTSSNPPSQR